MSTPLQPLGPVVVTGACGLVGKHVVEQLLSQGVEVIATDLDSKENRKWAATLAQRDGFRVDWCDLTEPAAVQHLLWKAAPTAIVHLAAIIPPLCYINPRLARRVNVDATAHLVEAAASLTAPPRFVQASSVATYGPRNPYRDLGDLTADTPQDAFDIYGAQKAESEKLVRNSCLEWTVLRLGGVMTVDISDGGEDMGDFGALLPADGRIHTVDVRDVARAFAAAATGPREVVAGKVYLIGGDATHRLLQRDIGSDMTTAMGLENGLPALTPGRPEDDQGWFSTDWMDTAQAQADLDFQRHSWPDMMAEIRAKSGRMRYLLRLAAPITHALGQRRAVRKKLKARGYADIWNDVETRFGHVRED